MPASQTRSVSYRIGEAASGGMGAISQPANQSESGPGHSLQVGPRPLVHKCPLCINTDRKFWALGFVAMCQEATYAPQQNRGLLNHLVGLREQRRRNVEAKRPCGLQIEYELELCCPHHWKAAGCLPL